MLIAEQANLHKILKRVRVQVITKLKSLQVRGTRKVRRMKGKCKCKQQQQKQVTLGMRRWTQFCSTNDTSQRNLSVDPAIEMCEL